MCVQAGCCVAARSCSAGQGRPRIKTQAAALRCQPLLRPPCSYGSLKTLGEKKTAFNEYSQVG